MTLRSGTLANERSAVILIPGQRENWMEFVLRLLSNEAFQVGLLLLLALVVRLALHFRSPALVSKDSQSYFLPGWELARAEPFEIGQRRTPGYPLFIAGVILGLGEELRALALAQHLLGVASVGVTYLLGRATFVRASGLLAGAMVALNGPLLIYERYVMSETFFGSLLVLTMLATVLSIRRAGASRALPARSWRALAWPTLAGLALGLTVLTRPVAQVLIPLLAAGLLAAHGRQWRRGLLAALALLVGLAAVQGPWVLRNSLERGNASASTFGRTLIARTAYYDRGFVFDVPGQLDPEPASQRARQIIQEGARRQEPDGTIAGRLRQELGLDPVQVNRVMRDLAVEAILRNPGHFVEGTLGFAWRIFAGVDERLREHWEEYKDANPWDPRIRALVSGPSPAELIERSTASRLANVYQPARFTGLVAVFFALGCCLALAIRRFRPALLPATSAIVLLLASAALDGPVERYRYPVDPLISVLAAGGLFVGLTYVAGSRLARIGRVETPASARRPGQSRLVAPSPPRGEG